MPATTIWRSAAVMRVMEKSMRKKSIRLVMMSEKMIVGVMLSVLPIGTARQRRAPIERRAEDIPKPAFTGTRVLSSRESAAPGVVGVRLADLVPYIDWMPFFNAYEFRGTFPAILDDATVGEAARIGYQRTARDLEARTKEVARAAKS